jgi:hypothetical protein
VLEGGCSAKQQQQWYLKEHVLLVSCCSNSNSCDAFRGNATLASGCLLGSCKCFVVALSQNLCKYSAGSSKSDLRLRCGTS